MLRLDKVSKFYSQNGIVTTGFNKVDLSFNIGEFVAITGESGSGKSTLLNVISGIDTYEEGEMYILGHPTSGFSKEDMEDYRKKYIGNIFQTFNLINSYTVYQNVELVLLLSGYEKKDIKEKADEIISKVGLDDFRNTKASKLSGGQKQRVAIARALAKETPIIVADEPTGNLDTESAAEIIKLLHQISEDKLVIIVTHNYEQVEKYVTRKITMYDGRVTEDKVLNNKDYLNKKDKTIDIARFDNLSAFNTVRLGLRNTFNIPSKFMLLLVVFLFLCTSVFGEYASYRNAKDLNDYGYNEFFRYVEDDRIVVSRGDHKEFTDKDYKKLSEIENVEYIAENDFMLDTVVSLQDVNNSGNFYIIGSLSELSEFTGDIFLGKMADEPGEAVLYIPKDGYVDMVQEEVLENEAKIYDDYTGTILLNENLKITGLAYMSPEDEKSFKTSNYYTECQVLLSEETMESIRTTSLEKYCKQEISFAGKIFEGNSSSWIYKIIPNDRVEEGYIYLPEDISMVYPYNVYGQPLSIKNESLYFTDKFEFTAAGSYNKDNLNYYLGIKDYEGVAGSLFISPEDYNKMFNKGNYQSSILVGDSKLTDITAEKIREAGYNTFVVSDGKVNFSEEISLVNNLLVGFTLAGMLIVLFYVSYFIIKLILKSRNVYFSTIRMLGATKKNCSDLLKVELLAVVNIAFIICSTLIFILKSGKVEIDLLIAFLEYMKLSDFGFVYVIMCIMSFLLAARYSKQLFKKSAMNSYKEEV